MNALLLAALTLGAPFRDGGVLQRDRPVPVWGTADAGASVTVSFGGAAVVATADAAGRWTATLPPLSASKTSRALVLTSESSEISVSDLLVGEVWLAAGQSNMAFSFYSDNPRDCERSSGLVGQLVRRPRLRFARVPAKPASEPQGSAEIRWFRAEPEALLSPEHRVSAVAFYFAKTLEEVLDVPVGVIETSVGATAIDSWIPAEEYAGFVPPPPGAKRYPPQGYFNGMVAPLAPMACRGFIWYQGESNAKAGECGRYAEKLQALLDGWSRVFANPSLVIRLAEIAPCWNELVPELQCQQALVARSEPRARACVTGDIANLFDVHPNDKETVGRRLAALALRHDYGLPVRADSPSVRDWTSADGTVRLAVDGAERLHLYHPDWMYRTDPARTRELGFELKGADGEWRPAEILNLVRTVTGRDALTAEPTSEFRGQLEGREIVLRAAGVAEPRGVRYLFRKPWRAAVYNEASLPMGPFLMEKGEGK